MYDERDFSTWPGAQKGFSPAGYKLQPAQHRLQGTSKSTVLVRESLAARQDRSDMT